MTTPLPYSGFARPEPDGRQAARVTFDSGCPLVGVTYKQCASRENSHPKMAPLPTTATSAKSKSTRGR